MPSPIAERPQWWSPAHAILLVVIALRNDRRVSDRLRIGSSTTFSGGRLYHLRYRGDLTWSVYREGVLLGSIFNEDWTHYSYILPGDEPMTGAETSIDWRRTLRALGAA